ncbi:MAG: hypothetical protein KA248_08080 [Kiritimatiellae bacterium]|nr:hypothetical protein [Kiritimatiellia bacterium]
MKLPRPPLFAGTLLLTLAVWLAFTWPLPRHFTDGIPMSSQNVEKGHARAMMPGDHLQLLYHFELVRDMIAGRIPWFHNVYEFNTGDDGARYRPAAYFAPFSLPYALLAPFLGRAAAWNLVAFLSLWITALATAALAGRFAPGRLSMYGAALVALVIPFRWVNLLGGSPAGLAMMWVPVLALGLDMAIREHRVSGGVLAGAALLLCVWSDLQVFFFCAISLPLWALLSWFSLPEPLRGRWKPLLKALAPIGFFLLLVVLYRSLRHGQLAASGVSAGRSLTEVKLFSPTWRGLWQWAAEGLQSHVYIGWVLPALLLAGGISLVAALRRRGSSALQAPGGSSSRETGPEEISVSDGPILFFLFLLCCAALGDIVILALGVHGPFGGIVLKIVRALLPPYSMVRQTAKIFCLLPTLAALTAALGLGGLMRLTAGRLHGPAVLALILLAAEMRFQVRPTICLLDDGQAAYAAVREEAGAGAEPRALVIPLWPGDSSWTSIYEYYAQMYGIRMVNGYSPAVLRDYVENVFRALESANQGFLTDDQLARLAQMKVGYLLVHENAFPEKVSPFPVRNTLNRLLNDPRFTFLRQAENVWAFRIAPRPGDRETASCGASFPARRWEWEAVESEGGTVVPDLDAGGGAFWRAEAAGTWAATRPARVAPDPTLHWLVRGRGAGSVQAITRLGETSTPATPLTFESETWTWIAIPIAGHNVFQPIQLRVEHVGGRVELDLALLAQGAWPTAWSPGDRMEIPAACLFHGGYSDGDAVVFRTTHDPEAALLYGPKMPLPEGSYRIELVFSSQAPEGAVLGRLNVRIREEDESRWVPVIAGRPCVTAWSQTGSLPVNAVFVYDRDHDVKVVKLIIEATHAAR